MDDEALREIQRKRFEKSQEEEEEEEEVNPDF